jgi:hypothetical protein
LVRLARLVRLVRLRLVRLTRVVEVGQIVDVGQLARFAIGQDHRWSGSQLVRITVGQFVKGC